MIDSAELYAACAGSDHEAQAAAYQTLWEYLYRVALFIVRDQPSAPDLAQECAQKALIRIHNRLADCNNPQTFVAWAKRIASNIAIDELRRRKRLITLDAMQPDESSPLMPAGNHAAFEARIDDRLQSGQLRRLLRQAPISQRSYRLIVGRYFDGASDEVLAQVESDLAQQTVLPSHIQVTRSKNVAKLRQWEPIQSLWQDA